MPTNIQGTMFFVEAVGEREYGWSESHALPTANDLKEALNKLALLAIARAKLLGAGAYINYMRVSDVGIFRDSQVANGVWPKAALIFDKQGNGKVVPAPPPPGDPADATTWTAQPIGGVPLGEPGLAKGVPAADLSDLLADQPDVAVLVRMEGGTAPFKTRRSMLLRGLPDGITWTDTDLPDVRHGILSVNWLRYFDDYTTLLTKGDYGMFGLDQTSPHQLVTGIAVDANLNVKWSIQGLNANPGDRVRISGVKVRVSDGSVKTYAETLTVETGTGAGPFVFSTSNERTKFVQSSFLSGNPVLSMGQAQVQRVVIFPYTKAVPRHWAKKDTGAPFDRPRGRQKPRR